MKRSLSEQKETEKPQDKKVRQIEHVDGNWPSFIYILCMNSIIVLKNSTYRRK